MIPILAIIPLLVSGSNVIPDDDLHHSLISNLDGWLQTLIVIGTIVSIYFIGKYMIVPLLHVVAKTRLQELFTASALLLVLSVSYLMQLVGLSPALGALWLESFWRIQNSDTNWKAISLLLKDCF